MSHLPKLKDGYFVKNDYDRLRYLFDQVLSYFLNGVCVNKDVIKGFPPKLNDGMKVDLFSLFWVVRKIGDYEFVSKNNLWGFVTKECGLDSTHVGGLKGIYVKYLKDLDQWLSYWGFKDIKFETGEVGVFEKLDSLFRELSGCKWDLPNDGFESGKKGDGSIGSTLKFNEKLDLDMNSKPGISGINNANDKEEFFGGLDLNIAQAEVNLTRIDNADDKDEFFGGFDLNVAQTDFGFSRIKNVDDKDEYFGNLDLNIAQTELEFSRNDNFDEKDEDFGGLDLEMGKTEIGFSRINNVDAKVEEFSDMDDKRIEPPCKIAVNKVDVSRIKHDDKRVGLCSTNILGFQYENYEHKDKSYNDNNTMIFAKSNVKNVPMTQKRKKEESLSMSKMLDWLANAARNPYDAMIGSIPRSSKWKKYKGNAAWKQVLLVKETLFAKQNVDSVNKVYCSQKKRHMMHPSMYEDDKIPIHLSSKRLRCSQRVSSVKSCSCPGCTFCSSSQNKRVKKSSQILEIREIQDDACEDLDIESNTVRAEVPKWTGVVSESDPKWLGTRMWPPPEENTRKHQADNLMIGKGRQSLCPCLNRGSADCVRFHIAENRTKVKHTLGPLFYKWKFNHMGEEASVSWSVEEEAEFKSLVILARQELTDRSKSRHEVMSNFWRRATESIPFKTKDILVNYYFNVFVLRRRSYQNRINLVNIDSDDDEQDMGCEKIHALSLKCSNNTQFRNLES